MIKKIVYLLVGGFVAISAAVAFVPSITGVVTTGLTAGSPVAEILLILAKLVIPLGVGLVILMMGVNSLRKKRR